jgi:Zn-dependent protease with chaperone function
MDFFEAQARAHQRTKRLVFLFAFAVLGTVLAGYASVMFGLRYAGDIERQTRPTGSRHQAAKTALFTGWWEPRIFLWTVGGTLAVVGFASLYKWSQMRAGGSAVAEMVGGRAVDLKTTDLRERKLLNVIEEMSIASGIPMPAVYVLEDEPGLNAFAAGLTSSDAAVAVTRGTLDKLTRDELQGVIAHEFSHILNGDMRLNVRITAIVFGILVIGLLGRGLIQALFRGRVRSGGKKKGGEIPVILAIGLALMIIGYVGYFFGRLIQAAVSRQREFLADASAVQFTRNPGGITGALKKIGGYALGGTMVNPHAGEIGHFFIAQAFKSNFGGLWATHPPLAERIRAVDPSWDGQLFEPEAVVDIKNETFATAGFGGGQRFSAAETLQRVHATQPDVPPPRIIAPLAFKPAAIVTDIGALTESHFRHAQLLLDTIPARLREATRDPATAQALVYGLLLNGDKAARDQQQAIVTEHAGPESTTALAALRPALSLLDHAARLPLLQLSLPALRSLDHGRSGPLRHHARRTGACRPRGDPLRVCAPENAAAPTATRTGTSPARAVRLVRRRARRIRHRALRSRPPQRQGFLRRFRRRRRPDPGHPRRAQSARPGRLQPRAGGRRSRQARRQLPARETAAPRRRRPCDRQRRHRDRGGR